LGIEVKLTSPKDTKVKRRDNNNNHAIISRREEKIRGGRWTCEKAKLNEPHRPSPKMAKCPTTKILTHESATKSHIHPYTYTLAIRR
jgi:hypothetical protein